MEHVVLSLGSNIERHKNIRYAISEINARFGELTLSPVYETSAVGFDGPPFFNLVVGFYTELPISEVIAVLKEIEMAAGRKQGPKAFDSRILDIDVILYGEHNLRPQGLNVPRDEIERYAYVLKPLADIYPDLLHPILGLPIASIWQNFEAKDQTLFIAEFSLDVTTALS